MASIGAVMRYLTVSLVLGGVVLFGLARALSADVEIVAAAAVFLAFAFVVSLSLVLPLAIAKSTTPINRTAFVLFVALCLASTALVFIGPLTGGAVRMTVADSALLGELFLPCASALLIQWWFVRRRWRHVHGLFPPGVDPEEASRLFSRGDKLR